MSQKTKAIRQLNDKFRQTRRGDRIILTSGIMGLGPGAVRSIFAAIAAYDSFDAGNDPYGEHDFGCIKCQGDKIFWKIEYYDRSYQAGSLDPGDASLTERVMTAMLAEEYSSYDGNT